MRTNPDIGPDQTPHSSARSSIECLPRSSAPLHTAKPMLTESRPKTVFANSLCARQRDLNRFELPRDAKMAKMAEKETPRRNSAAQTSQTLRENVLGAVLSRPSLGKWLKDTAGSLILCSCQLGMGLLDAGPGWALRQIHRGQDASCHAQSAIDLGPELLPAPPSDHNWNVPSQLREPATKSSKNPLTKFSCGIVEEAEPPLLLS